MAITFDPKKSVKNLAERGLSFERVNALEWDTAQIRQDTRKEYGEVRLRVFALLDGRLHAVVVSPRDGNLRVISFRKANKREMRQYAKNK